jgi:quercetin dioxygenase-like cupin family protein
MITTFGWKSIVCGCCLGVLTTSAAAAPIPDPLGRGTFVEDVELTLKTKSPNGSSGVLKIKDASDMFVLRITIRAGDYANWHTHTGPGTLINLGPGTLTNVVGDDCMPRTYVPGDAFVDPGVGEPHAARNDSEEDVELLAVFYAVETSPVVPTAGPGGCDFVP